MHPSGKMILALYQNRVLRLWNLMEARCQFKRKVGLVDEDEEDVVESKKDEDYGEEHGEDEMSELKADLTIKDLNEIDRKPIAVKWEQSKGQVFVILYRRMIEVFDMTTPGAGDKPCTRTILDFKATSFDFASDSALVVSDERGNLITISNITDPETISMRINRTKFTRVKDIQAFEGLFLAAIVHEEGEGKLVIWNIDELMR